MARSCWSLARAERSTDAEFAGWEDRVRASPHATRPSCDACVRIEDKGPIAALHQRDVPDEDEAHAHLKALSDAQAEGLAIRQGRKVLEVRPPVRVHKGQAVRRLVELSSARTALFGGDDSTDLDAFAMLLVGEGALDAAVTA